MIVATVAATVAWQKLLVCGLPGTFSSPTVVRYGDMPLVRISGKALNCNLIRTAGANSDAAVRESAVTDAASDGAGSCFPHARRRARRVAAQEAPSYSVNNELTDSSLEIRVIVSARS